MRAFVALLVLVAASRAYAEDEWAKGVSKDNQAAADALFAEGNELFSQQAHVRAVEKYKAAIALWDHPAIRLNLAIAEIQLDHVLAAADDLDAALRFGHAMFTADQYQQAVNYQKLLRGRVGDLEVSCGQAQTTVLLDGKRWFECPGTQTKRILAGEHVIVGEAKDYMTISRRVFVAGGGTSHEKLTLLPIASVVTLVYPSPRWLPWTTLGTGVALGLGGVGVWVAGRREMDHFESGFEVLCVPACSAGLDANPVEQQLAEQRDSARLKGQIGVTMGIVGGAVGVAGAVWLILNRPERRLPKVDVERAGGGGSARVSWRF